METMSAQISFLILDFKVLPALLRFGMTYTAPMHMRVSRACCSPDRILVRLSTDYVYQEQLERFLAAAKVIEAFDAEFISFNCTDPASRWGQATPLSAVIRGFERSRPVLQLEKLAPAHA